MSKKDDIIIAPDGIYRRIAAYTRCEPQAVVDRGGRLGVITSFNDDKTIVIVQFGASGPFGQYRVRHLRAATSKEAEALGFSADSRDTRSALRLPKMEK